MKRKKINPRRIPIAKSEIDKDAILDEATKDDMYRAWLLVAYSLIELEILHPSQIGILADQINKQIGVKRFKADDYEMRRIENLIGLQPRYGHLDISHVKSSRDLEKFKKKVEKVAIHTSLCVVAFGLEASDIFNAEQLRIIFFNIDLTLAEIDAGCNSYKEIESFLAEKSMLVDVTENEDFTRVMARVFGPGEKGHTGAGRKGPISAG